MNRHSQLVLRQGAALATAVMLVLGVLLGVPLARAQNVAAEGGEQPTVLKLDNAEFRWGLNPESAGYKTHSGSNYFAAGTVAKYLTQAQDTLDQSEWKSSSGKVRIETSAGQLASWGDVNPTGKESSGIEFVFTEGEGEVDTTTGTASVEWSGTASVLYYSGNSYFTISDPKLTVQKGADLAQLTATLGGAASAQGANTWKELNPESDVLIANIPAADIFTKDSGFSEAPEYGGVKYSGGTQSTVGDFGAFPSPFVDHLTQVGIGPYFYSTGGSADANKTPVPVTVSWDAEDRTPAGNGGGREKGIVGQVIDDTIEDIIRSAGTDVSDTAAAWMDEAWKPAQPDAVKAAQEAQAGGATVSGPIGGADAAIGEAVVDAEFSAQFEEQYSSGTPVTAGTVGGTVATAPASSGGMAQGGAAAAPAPAQAAGVSTLPVAANLPLSEVVYSQSASGSDTGSSFQWQWLVGLALLAASGGLGYLLFLRKS